MSELPEILETVVVGPSDRLVIVLREPVSLADMHVVYEAVSQRGFADRVLVIVGVEQLAVLKGEVTG